MKMITLVFLATFAGILVNAEQGKKFISKHTPRPNVQDIKQTFKNIVSPFYEKPYIPQEVDKLTEESNIIKKDLSKYMTKAEIVGPAQPKGVEEHPTMYNTVIDSHPTSITHPAPKAVSANVPNGGADALFDDKGDLNLSSSEKGFESVILHGQIPVRLNPTLHPKGLNGNFENPVFIHKSEKTDTERTETLEDALSNQVKTDANTIKDRLRVANNKKEKLKVLKDGLKRLNQEAANLARKIDSSVKDILNAKDVGTRLNLILDNYEETLRRNNASQLKLVDIVEIKKQLKVKLMKELSGIRTSPNEFKILSKVNPDDLKRVIEEVRRKIGQY